MSLSDSQTKYKKILDGYDDFRTYVIVGYMRDTTNFGDLDVLHHIILVSSRVISRISYNNTNTTVS